MNSIKVIFSVLSCLTSSTFQNNDKRPMFKLSFILNCTKLFEIYSGIRFIIWHFRYHCIRLLFSSSKYDFNIWMFVSCVNHLILETSTGSSPTCTEMNDDDICISNVVFKGTCSPVLFGYSHPFKDS